MAEWTSAIHLLTDPTMKAFNEHKTISLSNKQIKALEIFEFQFNKLSKREQNELIDLFI